METNGSGRPDTAAREAVQGRTVGRLHSDPAPHPLLAELMTTWRGLAASFLDTGGEPDDTCGRDGARSDVYRVCADTLETALHFIANEADPSAALLPPREGCTEEKDDDDQARGRTPADSRSRELPRRIQS